MFWLLLLVSVTSVWSQSGEEENSTLIFIQTLSRHGDRSPGLLYPFDMNTLADWPEGLGKLSVLGRRQTYAVGKFLRSRYKGFVTSSPNEIRVNSSYVDRCLRSAECLSAAFYPPEGVWKFEKDLDWQPIPVNYLPPELDKYIGFERRCNKHLKEVVRLIQSAPMQAVFLEYKSALDNISDIIGVNISKGLNSLALNDTLYASKIHNISVPDWVYQYESELTAVANANYHCLYDSPDIVRLRSGPLLEKMIENMKRKIDGTDPDSKVQVYYSHDANLSSMLRALNFTGMPQPPYTATMIFELHKMADSSHTVRLLYINSTTPQDDIGEVHTLLLDGRSEFLPLEHFEESVQHLIPGDWEEECENN